MSQFPAGPTLAPPASTPFDRFPQPPYDPTRTSVVTGVALSSPLELEGGGFLELEGGGFLELEGGGFLPSATQYRPGAVA